MGESHKISYTGHIWPENQQGKKKDKKQTVLGLFQVSRNLSVIIFLLLLLNFYILSSVSSRVQENKIKTSWEIGSKY